MLNKYKAIDSQLKEITISNVKNQKYSDIFIMNFAISFFVGEVLEFFYTVIESNWQYYFSWTRMFDALGLYLLLSTVFTVSIIAKYSSNTDK